MRILCTLTTIILLLLLTTACSKPSAPVSKQTLFNDIQIYTSPNKDGHITTKSIEAAFDSQRLSIPGNNDMNKPFRIRFKKVHFRVYNLAMYINNDLTYKIIKKYPKFGALTPLTMSIWEDKDANMNIATLTIYGMSRATGIPLNDPDLIVYNALIKKTLQKAMPDGKFKALALPEKPLKQSFAIDMVANVEKGVSPEDFIEDFEAEFEAELEPLGFLFPNYTNLQEEIFDDYNYNEYDFYHTYSICKFDVIFPVSKLHPEAGAWAPCSFYLYKKKNDLKIHMGFLGVENWIKTLRIKDKESIQPLKEAQGMIIKVLKEISE